MPSTTRINANIAQHTPGPWAIEIALGGTAVTGPRAGADICRVFGGGTNDELLANARLIAAAPELLDDARQNDTAFTWLAEQMNTITDNAKHWGVERIEALAQDLRIGIEQNLKRTRAAIATAEGR